MSDKQIAIIKCAVGATGIARSIDYDDYIPALKDFKDRGKNWHPPSEGREAGILYRRLMKNVRDALSALDRRQAKWELAGCLWIQGEHEAGISRKMAEDYDTLLSSFISAVRSDLKTPSLPFVIGEVNSHKWAYGDIVRKKQTMVCGRDHNAVLVKTTDLSRKGSGGAAHFDADGMLLLGSRFAKAMNQVLSEHKTESDSPEPPVPGDGSEQLSADPISIESLLTEMSSQDALARYPDPAYRSLQASSYNRRSVARDKPGWFADEDGLGFVRTEKINGRTEWVIMEHRGPGCLTKFWTPFFYYGLGNRVGPNVRIYLDDASDPVIDACFIELLTRNEWPRCYGPAPKKRNTFRVPFPFAGHTARAGNLFLPIPFAKSCKVTLTSKPFYNIVNYRGYPEGTPVETFTIKGYRAATERMTKTGRHLLDTEAESAGPKRETTGNIQPGSRISLDLPAGHAIRTLQIQLDPRQVAATPALLRSTILRIAFDGTETIWCPLGDFFGSVNAINPMDTWTRSVTVNGRMVCRWVMPYQRDARISVENLGKKQVSVKLAAVTRPWRWTSRSMYFHASWRSDDIQPGNLFSDWNFVDIRGRGVFVGDQWTVLNPTRGWWGEGDEKIYVDDACDNKFPDHFGTGTEDYYGWAGGVVPTKADVFSSPFLANLSVGSTAQNVPRGFNICTRIRALDAIPFTSRLQFNIEASPGTSQRKVDDLLAYSAVSFWYARPGATSNRPPLPKEAAKPVTSLEQLQKQADVIRRKMSGKRN